MMYKIFAVLLSVAVTEIMEAGKTIGTSSNQMILGMLVVALILIVGYREVQQIRANRKIDAHHDELIKKADNQFSALLQQQDRDRLAWDDERRARVATMMQLVVDNTRTMDKTASAVLQNAGAVSDLKDVIGGFKEILFKLEHVLSK